MGQEKNCQMFAKQSLEFMQDSEFWLILNSHISTELSH